MHASARVCRRLLPAIMAVGIVTANLEGAGAALLLADGRQPRATIVLAERPTRAAQMAAAELQHHIGLITGARLPIVREPAAVTNGVRILVGATRAAEALGLPGTPFGEQEYLIAFRTGALVLMGRDKPDFGELDYQCNSPAVGTTAGMPDFCDEQGTLYAAYDFLERHCGVRWYLPTELGTVFDPSDRLTVSGRDVRRAPAMKHRYVHMGYRFPEDLKGDTLAAEKPRPALAAREHRLFYLRHRIGGEPYAANHSLYGWYRRYWDEQSPAFEKKRPDFFAQGYDFIMNYHFSFRPPFAGKWEESRALIHPDGEGTASVTFGEFDEPRRKSGGLALSDAQREPGWLAVQDRGTGLGLAVFFNPSSAARAQGYLRRSWFQEASSSWKTMPADLLVETFQPDAQQTNTLENTFTVWALSGETPEALRAIHAGLAAPTVVDAAAAELEKRPAGAGGAAWPVDEAAERLVFRVAPGAGPLDQVRPVTLAASAILGRSGLKTISVDSLRLFRDDRELAVQAAETEPERLFAVDATPDRLGPTHAIVFLDAAGSSATARYRLYYAVKSTPRTAAGPGGPTVEQVPAAAFKRYDYRLRNARLQADIRCADASNPTRVRMGASNYTGQCEGSIVGLTIDGHALVDHYTPLLTTWFQQHDQSWANARVVTGPVLTTVVAHRRLDGVYRHGQGSWSATWSDYVNIQADLYRSFTVFDRLPLVMITDRFTGAKVTPRIESGTQLCYSHPEVVAQVAQDARDYFDGKGLKPGSLAGGDHFAVVPMDQHMWCRCANCRRWMLAEPTFGKGKFSNNAASDYVFQFVNAVAREVRRTHPDKFISTLAYWEYCYPPANVELEPNINVGLCLHSRGWGGTYTRGNDDLDILRQWRARPEHPRLYLWLYYCFPSLSATQQKFRMFPAFFAPDIVDHLAIFHRAGVHGMKYEPSYLAHSRQSPLLDQLEFYVTWRLADNPKLDGRKLIDEFFTRYYGPAAKPMRAFYMLAAAIWRDPANRPDGVQGPELSWGHLGTPERMEQLGGYMRDALRRVEAKGTETEKRRVALFNEGIWQFMQKGFEAYHQPR